MPTFVGAASASIAGATVSVAPHASTQVGDLLLAWQSHKGSSGTCTAPAGWTAVTAQINTSTVIRSKAWWKVATLADLAADNWACSGTPTPSSVAIVTLRNARNGDPINASNTQSNGGSAATIGVSAVVASGHGGLVSFGARVYHTEHTSCTGGYTRATWSGVDAGGHRNSVSAWYQESAPAPDPPAVAISTASASVSWNSVQIAVNDPLATGFPRRFW